MSNFSFSHHVFKRLKLQTRKNQGLFGKGLIPLPEDKILPLSKLKAFANNSVTVAQKVTSIFSFFSQCYLLYQIRKSSLNSLPNNEILDQSKFESIYRLQSKCKYYQFGPVQMFPV